MNRTRRALAFLATLISATAMMVTMIGGPAMFALEGLLQIVTLGLATGALVNYPLGRGILVLYACGLALGAAASRWPVAAGVAGSLILATGSHPARA